MFLDIIIQNSFVFARIANLRYRVMKLVVTTHLIIYSFLFFYHTMESCGSGVLETTVGYLLGETEDRELLKDPTMLKRLNDIAKFSKKDKEHILYTLDAMISNVKLKAI